MNQKKNKYINEYVAGFLMGLLIIAAYYFAGEGLGSSGGFRDVAVSAIDAVSHDYATSNSYIASKVSGEHAPTHTWLVYELLGVILGAILSAALFGRLKFVIGKAPHITNKKRLYLALAGGILWGIGTQLGRGCTSGLVLSGMAVNSLSGYIGLVAIFGFGFIFAFIFKRLWIKKN
jgi:hypothetical protein